MELSLIGLKEYKPNIRKSQIDYNKLEFTDQEKTIIKKEVDMIKTKYPNYIPIIVRTKKGTKKNSDLILNKTKYLVGEEITISQFIYIIRKKIKNLNNSDSIYIFINNSLPIQTKTLGSIYSEYKNIETDMLFVTVCKENTFGKN